MPRGVPCVAVLIVDCGVPEEALHFSLNLYFYELMLAGYP